MRVIFSELAVNLEQGFRRNGALSNACVGMRMDGVTVYFRLYAEVGFLFEIFTLN